MVATSGGSKNCITVIRYDSLYTETYVDFIPGVFSLYEKRVSKMSKQIILPHLV